MITIILAGPTMNLEELNQIDIWNTHYDLMMRFSWITYSGYRDPLRKGCYGYNWLPQMVYTYYIEKK